MDPDNLERADASSMDFSKDRQKPKSWKEIWGSGQGIGSVREVLPASVLVDRLAREYIAAKAEMAEIVCD